MVSVSKFKSKDPVGLIPWQDDKQFFCPSQSTLGADLFGGSGAPFCIPIKMGCDVSHFVFCCFTNYGGQGQLSDDTFPI